RDSPNGSRSPAAARPTTGRRRPVPGAAGGDGRNVRRSRGVAAAAVAVGGAGRQARAARFLRAGREPDAGSGSTRRDTVRTVAPATRPAVEPRYDVRAGLRMFA